MGKIFSCNFENCGFVFKKQSDLNKHIVEHEDPSKLFRCTECTFITKYSKGFTIHVNTHSDEKPYACPDMVKVPSSESDSSSQPVVSEIPCEYRSNCNSALIKHRKKYHGYTTDPNRSRRGAPAPSQVDRRIRVLRYDPFPVPPKRTISSNDQASCSAKDSSARAYPFVTFPPLPVVQPFDNKHHSAPDTRYGEVWNKKSYALAAKSIDANSSVASQNTYAYRSVTTLPFPILPNSPATVLCQDSFYYVTNNAIVMSDDVTHTSPEPPYNATSSTWLKASKPGAESTSSDSFVSYTADYYNSESSALYATSPPSPAKLPFDDRLSSYLDTLQGKVSNNGTFRFAQESTDASSAVASQYNYADRGVTTALPFPILPNSPATVSRHDPESFYITSNDLAHTSPGTPYNATALASLEKPSTPEAESTDSGSVASYTVNCGSSPQSYVPFPPSPAELPFDNNVYSESDTLYDVASNDNGYIGTLAVELIDANSSVAPQNNYADCDVTLLGPSPLPIPAVLPAQTFVDDYSASGATEIVFSLSDLETSIHKDEIFFRGTGLEGCLCPEMMMNAGVEGWDRPLLDTHQVYYTPSFA